MNLLIQTYKGPETIAWITRLHGEGEKARYRCEVLRRDGVRITGKRGLPHVQLMLGDGVSETMVSVQGESEWGPLPWVFAERKGQWQFIGEGSVRCRDEKVYILIPKGGLLTTENGVLSFTGEAPELDRELWRAEGTVTWEHENLGVCRIRCANPDAADVTYVLSGRTLQGTAEQDPPYKGIPELFSVNQNGIRRIVEDVIAEWCPQGLGKRLWQSDFSRCAGEVWLRWGNMAGEQILVRKLRVVPSAGEIKITCVGVDQPTWKALHYRVFRCGFERTTH